MTIRKAMKADARKMGACHYYCWQETYRGLVSDTYLNNMDKYKNMDRFEKLFDIIGEHQYVAEEQKQIIGFFDILKSNGEYAPFEVGALYLRKEYQGKGYGREIFDFIKKKTESSPFCLWCLSSNPACGFYLHMGGRQIDTKEEIIGDRTEIEVCYLFKSE